MQWRVDLASGAARDYRRLAEPARRRVARAIDELAQGPRPSGKHVKAIERPGDRFLRYRIGDYRLIYEVFDSRRLVLVAGIVARKDFETWLKNHR